jgi:hypothetical protein
MSIAVYHADCMLLDLNWLRENAHVMITDPPYSSHVHANATSQSKVRGTRKRDLGFEHLGAKLRRQVARFAAAVPRWSVIYSDVESTNWLRLSCQAAGATYIRTLPWIRWSMPQLSGDRPPTGWEAVLLTHGWQGGRKHWTGPGNLLSLSHKCLRGEDKHKAEKPLDQALDLVDWFSDPGETVFDPFAGSGVFGMACMLLGRNYIGIELNPEWAERAQRRARGEARPYDEERWNRWHRSRQEAVGQTG